MIKTYRKVSTIQAEQFDGSDEMVKKYNIEHAEADYPTESNGLEYVDTYYLTTIEGTFIIYIGNWIATGVDGEHWAIKDDIFKKSYVEAK